VVARAIIKHAAKAQKKQWQRKGCCGGSEDPRGGTSRQPEDRKKKAASQAQSTQRTSQTFTQGIERHRCNVMGVLFEERDALENA
jgi:hypothetical protein